ncbi:hypothetical protein [Paenibacillus sp. 481]|uniref:hypothetical protein n=1 Tax=Paenibacillus sp. 481 TaxID=2835869 RepID=UPI001E65678A|nr:hypothetical protein [Paenibacillus sp. 481]UHA72142.1 hypothetical protein KIK04_15710 [Paenibacillus sp. 481]
MNATNATNTMSKKSAMYKCRTILSLLLCVTLFTGQFAMFPLGIAGADPKHPWLSRDIYVYDGSRVTIYEMSPGIWVTGEPNRDLVDNDPAKNFVVDPNYETKYLVGDPFLDYVFKTLKQINSSKTGRTQLKELSIGFPITESTTTPNEAKQSYETIRNASLKLQKEEEITRKLGQEVKKLALGHWEKQQGANGLNEVDAAFKQFETDLNALFQQSMSSELEVQKYMRYIGEKLAVINWDEYVEFSRLRIEMITAKRKLNSNTIKLATQNAQIGMVKQKLESMKGSKKQLTQQLEEFEQNYAKIEKQLAKDFEYVTKLNANLKKHIATVQHSHSYDLPAIFKQADKNMFASHAAVKKSIYQLSKVLEPLNTIVHFNVTDTLSLYAQKLLGDQMFRHLDRHITIELFSRDNFVNERVMYDVNGEPFKLSVFIEPSGKARFNSNSSSSARVGQLGSRSIITLDPHHGVGISSGKEIIHPATVLMHELEHAKETLFGQGKNLTLLEKNKKILKVIKKKGIEVVPSSSRIDERRFITVTEEARATGGKQFEKIKSKDVYANAESNVQIKKSELLKKKRQTMQGQELAEIERVLTYQTKETSETMFSKEMGYPIRKTYTDTDNDSFLIKDPLRALQQKKMLKKDSKRIGLPEALACAAGHGAQGCFKEVAEGETVQADMELAEVEEIEMPAEGIDPVPAGKEAGNEEETKPNRENKTPTDEPELDLSKMTLEEAYDKVIEAQKMPEQIDLEKLKFTSSLQEALREPDVVYSPLPKSTVAMNEFIEGPGLNGAMMAGDVVLFVNNLATTHKLDVDTMLQGGALLANAISAEFGMGLGLVVGIYQAAEHKQWVTVGTDAALLVTFAGILATNPELSVVMMPLAGIGGLATAIDAIIHQYDALEAYLGKMVEKRTELWHQAYTSTADKWKTEVLPKYKDKADKLHTILTNHSNNVALVLDHVKNKVEKSTHDELDGATKQVKDSLTGAGQQMMDSLSQLARQSLDNAIEMVPVEMVEIDAKFRNKVFQVFLTHKGDFQSTWDDYYLSKVRNAVEPPAQLLEPYYQLATFK